MYKDNIDSSKVKVKTWEEFSNTGLLWVTNSILQIFGWSIETVVTGDTVTAVHPVRLEYRGFTNSENDKGYRKISKYMNDNSKDLLTEVMQWKKR